MSDRIDISEPITDICKRLGLEPSDVGHIDFRPRHVTAIVFKRNDHGAKYIENGEPVTEIHEFEVTT